MRILLDANTYSLLLLHDQLIAKTLTEASHIVFSSIVIGELLYGYKKGSKELININRLNVFLSHPSVDVINVTKNTAQFYALIRNELANNGSPMPSNDMWIAAHAIESNSTLLTYDKHFQNIPNLRIWPKSI